MVKRFLFFAALVAFAGLVSGCKEDTPTTTENPVVNQPSENPAPTPGDPDTPAVGPQEPADSNAICYANNFVGEKFRVVSYSNKVIVANKEPTNCRLINDRLKGEVRRGGVRGLREFVGDVRAIRGNRITIYTGSLPRLCRPKKGEILKVIWKPRRRR